MARGPEPSASRRPLEPRLVERLARRAEPDGFLPFDRFMDVALYDEGVGYYARGASPPGPTGDFYTAPQLDPIFARCVAARAAEVARAVPPGRPFRWVELGPGDGGVSAEAVPALAHELGDRLTEAVLIDRSGPLRARALERVARAVEGHPLEVRAVGSLADVGPTCGFLFANELFDAQPVQQYRRIPGGWAELGTRLAEGRLEPAERTVQGPPAALAGILDVPEGTVVERSPRSEALVREVADHLVDGACVLVDYGGDGAELRARHPSGTVAAVRGHRPVADPLEAPGETDLSAFVDFGRIREVARSAGLHETAYRRQAEALVAWGLERELAARIERTPDPAEQVKARLAVKKLLFGFESFRVLELAARAA